MSPSPPAHTLAGRPAYAADGARDVTDALSLWGLFASAFVSSTLFPGGSEVALGVLAAQDRHDPWLLLAVASFGNTLGALTTWLLGFLRLPFFASLLFIALGKTARYAVILLAFV